MPPHLKNQVRIQGRRYRAQYTTAIAAFRVILRDEGLLAFWTGVWPTVYRASILAAVELSLYDNVKGWAAECLQLTRTDLRVFVVAALVASFFSAIISCPFDVARSRMMNQSAENGKKDGSWEEGREGGAPVRVRYRNAFHCLFVSVSEEGILVLWNGVLSYLLRLVPNAIFTFVFLEKVRAMLTRLNGIPPPGL